MLWDCGLTLLLRTGHLYWLGKGSYLLWNNIWHCIVSRLLISIRRQVISPWYEVAPSEVAPLLSHPGDIAPLFEWSRPTNWLPLYTIHGAIGYADDLNNTVTPFKFAAIKVRGFEIMTYSRPFNFTVSYQNYFTVSYRNVVFSYTN